ncbi:MAG: hypothetical protein KC464_16540, partial [Myxococcales bacterium]|nr:hypothetical protein [Myxococcales bacterium]
RQRRASCSSVIFRCSLIDSSSESTRLSAARRGVTPASLMAHAPAHFAQYSQTTSNSAVTSSR